MCTDELRRSRQTHQSLARRPDGRTMVIKWARLTSLLLLLLLQTDGGGGDTRPKDRRHTCYHTHAHGIYVQVSRVWRRYTILSSSYESKFIYYYNTISLSLFLMKIFPFSRCDFPFTVRLRHTFFCCLFFGNQNMYNANRVNFSDNITTVIPDYNWINII